MLHAINAVFFTGCKLISHPCTSSGLGVILTTIMFIACAAYVAAGVSAILDLRFIAINKRRNYIITTVVRTDHFVHVSCSLSTGSYQECIVLERGTGTLHG